MLRFLPVKNPFVLLAVFFTATSCAHYPDVRPGSEGVHYVSISGDDEDDLARDGLRQANSYCKSTHKKTAGVVSEKKEYINDMDEKNYKNAKRASTVAKVVGSAGMIYGGKTERKVGGVSALGGVAGDSAVGKGYKVTIKFKCI